MPNGVSACETRLALLPVERKISYLVFALNKCKCTATQSLQAARPRFWGEDSLSFEMSVKIQIIFVGDFCSVICFWNRPIYGATLSLRAYRQRAQDSEEMVVSLLKCWSFIQIIIVGYFCSVICFWNRPKYGATLSLRAYRRRAQDSEVMVASLLKWRSLSKLLL